MRDILQLGAATNRLHGRVTPRMRRASYRDGVAWIAANDEPGEATSRMLADLCGVDPDRVDRDVERYRRKHGIGGAS